MTNSSRKKINDVIVPQNDIVRRPSMVPETTHIPSASDRGSRIEKNPFFEKTRAKKTEVIKPKTQNSHGILWSLLFVVLLVLGFAIVSYFATATIEIVPITRSVELDNDVVAVKDSEGEELAFDFTARTETLTKEVSATIETEVQKLASGRVVIYNAYSSASQKLIKNTRLETPDGKIYRIDESVIVPGAQVSSGKVVTPGSIEVIAYADVPGEKYNIDPTNFTIPGFKGDPRYEKFTAVSKPDSPMTGGFDGTVNIPSDEAVAQAREDLKQDLKKIVVEKLRVDIPEEMTFFPGSMVVKYEEVPQDYSGDNASKVSMRATASAFFFETELLVELLVEEMLPEDIDKVLEISNMSELTFKFLDPVDDVVLSDISELKFNILGTALFSGVIDSENIKQMFAGTNKKDFKSMIVHESNVYKADATIRPVWKTVFPVDPARITVKVVGK